jgi:hypothetical protein
MSDRRRQTPDGALASQLSKTERLAAVSPIRFVRRRLCKSVCLSSKNKSEKSRYWPEKLRQ